MVSIYLTILPHLLTFSSLYTDCCYCIPEDTTIIRILTFTVTFSFVNNACEDDFSVESSVSSDASVSVSGVSSVGSMIWREYILKQ